MILDNAEDMPFNPLSIDLEDDEILSEEFAKLSNADAALGAAEAAELRPLDILLNIAPISPRPFILYMTVSN